MLKTSLGRALVSTRSCDCSRDLRLGLTVVRRSKGRLYSVEHHERRIGVGEEEFLLGHGAGLGGVRELDGPKDSTDRGPQSSGTTTTANSGSNSTTSTSSASSSTASPDSSPSSSTPLPPRSFTPPPQNRPRPLVRPNHLRSQVQLPTNFGRNQTIAVTSETKKKLERIVGQFRAVRWAVAYGSGVFDQDGYETSTSIAAAATAPATDKGKGKEVIAQPEEPAVPGSKPLIDFLFATSHPSHFHSINLAANPTHYPLFARLLGSDIIARIQETWGAGVWYATMISIPGSSSKIKYGVISTDALCEDLMDWTTLYVSGRMHKPVRIINRDPRVLLANQVNLTSALRVALLMLPEEFEERELWEKIAGISYAGDPRMSIPGGENPQKVQNIVRPPASLKRFRGLYHKLLAEIGGVQPKDRELMKTLGAARTEDEERWRALGMGLEGGKGLLVQDKTPEFRAGLLRKLPKTARAALEKRYTRKFGVGLQSVTDSIVNSTSGEPKDEKADLTSEEFWLRVAKEDEATFVKVMDDELRKIIRYPAIAQTLKGFVTAGFIKSVRYAARKVNKWWHSGTK